MTSDEPYPYLIHTNRELELMLAGKKPLAVFAHERVEGFKKSDALAGQDFERYVATGTISEHVRSFERQLPDGSPVSIDYYFYALPGEEWRVQAYCLLLDMLHKTGWCSHLEWVEGTLLGYTEEQNQYHLSRRYPERSSNH
jgi:hypothetical protein